MGESNFVYYFVSALASVFIWIFLDQCVLFKMYAQKIKGRIVDITWKKSMNSSIKLYSPVVEIVVDGQEYKFTNDLWASHTKYSVGQDIDVEYLKGLEKYARVPSILRNLFMVMGVLFGGVAIKWLMAEGALEGPIILILVILNGLLCMAVLKKYIRLNKLS